MAAIRYFFYGTLCHAPLLRVVLGRDAALTPAVLAGHAVHWAEGQSFPVIREEAGRSARGLLTEELSREEAARLDFYEGGFAYGVREVEVEAGGARVTARVYLPEREWPAGVAWNLADWQRDWGEIVTEAACDFMALRGLRPPEEILARYPQMLVRAASRLRAAPGGPATLRRAAAPGDVRIQAWRQPYARYFAVEDMDLSFRRFDGSMSEAVNRSVWVTGDAATVLPYDPARDVVLLVEQFRPGPFARGDAQPWLLEPVAGRIDPGETPEQAIRREAREEAGIELGALIPIAGYYPSPAGNSEYLFSYIGLADLPEAGPGRTFGVAGEHEDIRVHVIPFQRLMQLVEGGEAENGPLLLSALFLAGRRDALRRAA